MTEFIKRVGKYLTETQDSNFKSELEKVLELSQYKADETFLRNYILESLSKDEQISEDAKIFYKIEHKIATLNEMGLNDAFEKLSNSDELNKINPQIGYSIQRLHKAYVEKTDAIQISETLIGYLTPYTYNPLVEGVIDSLRRYFIKYNEDIAIIRTMKAIGDERQKLIMNEAYTKLNDYLTEQISRKELILNLSKFNFNNRIAECINYLEEIENKGKDTLRIVNENKNFDVKKTYTFFANENNLHYIVNNNRLVSFDGNDYKFVNETVNNLPADFINMNLYVQGRNVSIKENLMDVYVGKERFTFDVDNKIVMYNNNKVNESEVYKFISNLRNFDGDTQHYNFIKKIYENLDTLVEVENVKNIVSKTNPEINVSVYKNKDTFSIHMNNPYMKINKVVEGLNPIQLKNAVYDFIGFDISKSIVTVSENYKAKLDGLALDKQSLQEALDTINTKLVQINYLLESDEIELNDEIEQIKEELEKNILSIKSEINKIDVEVDNITNINEKEVVLNSMVRVKTTGIMGKVTALNDVTKAVSVLTDEGETLTANLEDIEVIDMPYEVKQHDNEEKVAKEKSDFEVKEEYVTDETEDVIEEDVDMTDESAVESYETPEENFQSMFKQTLSKLHVRSYHSINNKKLKDKIIDQFSKKLGRIVNEEEMLNLVNSINEAADSNKILKINYKKLKQLANTVINPGMNGTEYYGKKIIEFDVDHFVDFVKDNMDGKGYLLKDDYGILENIFIFKGNKTPFILWEEYKHTGSGIYNDENYKKYKTWSSALYDIWDDILNHIK